ncbi:hypothetical protein EZ313_21390 [Ramlibacter henchirensis]|uniref:FecR protein domain-containing protein n=1 Tax=Ramlibacter henchirensis TaxID=204072 RepID=A0A4Z0BQC8_9BURK|nr:FecR domain-containing protein [Ramlibacter henchirensis]TFZ00982.1 hypothetical protein EZ313_21390 [Ramlibacter henchirensis]
MLELNIHRSATTLCIGALLTLCGGAALAQSAGEVEFARGVGFAQSPGQPPRTLGKGLPLSEGDRLTTSDGASAILRLEDGTRMTVRPNSELVITQYRYRENASDNNMLLQMVRGGFRAVTGLISKNAPNAAKVQTSTATIGIRGTDFDARLCSRDCGAEAARVAESARPNAVLASAKVVQSQGEIHAVDADNNRRRLVEGGGIYPGDVVETAPGARAVIAFRDDSRITLGSSTRFRIDNFVYDEQNAGEGRFLASLLRGSVRALTGLIAKANNRNVGLSTATATIGIRGTGFDAACPGECTGNNLNLFTWLGSIAVTPQGRTGMEILQAGQGLVVLPTGTVEPLTAPPAIEGPRPDEVTVPPKLFAMENLPDTEEGLFVYVRDGHIEVATAGDVLHLGRGEAGFAAQQGTTVRPLNIPKFLDFDVVPMPTSRNPLLQSVLQDNNIKARNTCT